VGWWFGWLEGIKKRMGKIQSRLYIYISANGKFDNSTEGGVL
jgi:hypothetical protein